MGETDRVLGPFLGTQGLLTRRGLQPRVASSLGHRPGGSPIGKCRRQPAWPGSKSVTIPSISLLSWLPSPSTAQPASR